MVLLIASAAWLVLRALHVAEGVAFSRLPGQTRADGRVRRARTQIRPVRRLASIAVTVAAIGLILTTFPPLRTIGLSVLTSAGAIGALLGLSARTALGNAFAGIQVAFADGLQVGDVIVIDGQWGRVEEVKLTNVVIRLWDDRMLILPTHLLHRTLPTRHETRVVGQVRIHVDHTADLDDLRAETRRLVESSPLWDRHQWVLQMVDATPQTVVVQIQASAADGPSAWTSAATCARCSSQDGTRYTSAKRSRHSPLRNSPHRIDPVRCREPRTSSISPSRSRSFVSFSFSSSTPQRLSCRRWQSATRPGSFRAAPTGSTTSAYSPGRLPVWRDSPRQRSSGVLAPQPHRRRLRSPPTWIRGASGSAVTQNS
ncbi:mechanosensitive ion channel family protein [Micromonospora globbae]|uniref:mechanosensitive ion channel family protein n=1 Tax=Micromonospora globbae TaxID=1894969 RepID=UPI00341FCF1C